VYARMTSAQTQPERFDDALNAVEQIFMAAAREQHGYRGFLLLSDRETQQFVGISLWETEKDLEHSSSPSGYYQAGLADFARMLQAPPETSTFDVALHEA
jgi:heme-degrading monooxygenase HmoA